MAFYQDRKYFDTTDYIIFAITLIIPILIGMYYSFISKRRPKTVSEYLVGNRNMSFFPVAMSLAASVISGSYIIGPISEVYFYGIQFILRSAVMVKASYCFVILYLPPFYNLKITSTFEYLQARFDYKVRLLGSALFLIKTVLNMTVWIYAPSVMLEQVTGLNFKVIIPICSGICIFYSIGGVRSVVWADTFQMIAMLLGIIIITVVGVCDVGVEKIWTISQQGKRLDAIEYENDYNLSKDSKKQKNIFNPDPRLRHSFWIIMVGNGVNTFAGLISSQFVVQRCVSLSTLSKSKAAVMVQSILSAATIALSSYVGLILYTAFHDCDPISAKSISKPDQLLPHYIMNLKNQIPGLPSVVISIAFCSALSSISSALNSTSGVILIDFIRPLSKRPITDAQGSFYMKIIAITIGVLYTGITYTLSTANNLIQTTISLTSIALGASLGIFTLGVLLPWANANGAFLGGITGGLVIAWISIGSQITSGRRKWINSTLPLSIENCQNSTMINFGNETLAVTSGSDESQPFFLYAISFHYYSMIGALTAIIIGMIVSYFTGFNNPKDMNPKLFSPVIHKYLKREEATCEITDML